MIVKPKRGLKVFNPATKLHIDENGTEVGMSTYWKRRLKDDEIEVVEIAPVKKTEPMATKKTSKKVNKKNDISMEAE